MTTTDTTENEQVTPPSEENQIVTGMHRETGTRFGFWLEEEPDSSSPDLAAIPNPSAPNTKTGLIWLEMPQDYVMDETPAVTIAPTQGGGKLIEDRGIITKVVTISGTTGYTPRPLNQKVNPSTSSTQPGSKLPQLTDEAALQRSGYKAFIDLRNLFRKYEHIQRYGTPDQISRTRMHFLDTKLGDFWIIQPRNFSLHRSSRSPMTFPFSVRFETIAPSAVTVDRGYVKLPEAKEASKINAPNGINPSFVDRLRAIRNSIRDKSQSVATEAITAVTSYLNVVDEMVAVLSTPAFAVRDLVAVPLTLLKRAQNSLEGLLNAVLITEDTFNPNSRYWNETYLEGRNIFESIQARSTVLYDKTIGELLGNSNNKWIEQRGLGSDSAAGVSGALSALPNQPFISGSGLDNTRSQSLSSVVGIRKAQVVQGDTIYSLSYRETGSIQNVHDIVVINGLVPPFVLDNTSGMNRLPGVLYPGDFVLVPTNVASPSAAALAANSVKVRDNLTSTLTGVTSTTEFEDTAQDWLDGVLAGYIITIGGDVRVILTNTSNTFTINRPFAVTPSIGNTYLAQNISFSTAMSIPTVDELTYGRDIVASFDFSFGAEKSIVGVLNASGDFATVTGLENYIQALKLLTTIEQGRLMQHPFYGNPLPIGERATLSELEFYKLLVSRAIMMDSRTLEVVGVNLTQVFDRILPVIQVKPIGTSKTVTTREAS